MKIEHYISKNNLINELKTYAYTQSNRAKKVNALIQALSKCGRLVYYYNRGSKGRIEYGYINEQLTLEQVFNNDDIYRYQNFNGYDYIDDDGMAYEFKSFILEACHEVTKPVNLIVNTFKIENGKVLQVYYFIPQNKAMDLNKSLSIEQVEKLGTPIKTFEYNI